MQSLKIEIASPKKPSKGLSIHSDLNERTTENGKSKCQCCLLNDIHSNSNDDDESKNDDSPNEINHEINISYNNNKTSYNSNSESTKTKK